MVRVRFSVKPEFFSGSFSTCLGCLKKKTFYLSVNVFSTKELIGDTIFMSPTRDRNAILCGNPSHVKV